MCASDGRTERGRTREPEGDVLEHRHVAEQRIVLEDEPHTPVARSLPSNVPARRRAQRLAGSGPDFQAGDDAQERSLSRAGWPQQRHQFAIVHIQAHVAQRDEAPEGLGNPLDRDAHRYASRPSADARLA